MPDGVATCSKVVPATSTARAAVVASARSRPAAEANCAPPIDKADQAAATDVPVMNVRRFMPATKTPTC
ncbi:hypothetical protein GCM10010502_28910 [Kitasatospora aureofaciens]|uniref:Uncharacterized protein n=1 Tax=Kitasatospora aureofaciens TaxID=1894 RepID=A0A8H9HLV1_KITAU|nr:hypothetical protein GCM10010502_28910 [Kitasatospora aureofaciens]